MNLFLNGLLWGLGISLIGVPIVIFITHKIKKTLERRKIKKMIKRGEILKAFDEKDYDKKIWDKYYVVDKGKEEDKLNKLTGLVK